MNIENNIPKHWQVKKLREICKIYPGYGFPKNIQGSLIGKYPFYKVGDISKNVKEGNRVLEHCDNYIDERNLLKLKAKPYPQGTVVFAKIGEALKLNRRAIINFPAIVDNNAIGVKAIENYCDDLFLYHFLTTVKLEEYSKATTVPSVRKSEIEEIPFLLPPLPEQQLIVSKIEELLSDLENGKQQLLLAQQQLKVYRQSLLKWAFLNGSFKDYILKEVTEKIQIGPFGTQLHKEDYIGNGIPLINPMHIQEGNIQADYSYSITKEKRDSLPNYILKYGDVIMGRRGEMGRCGLVKEKESGWLCGTGSLYFRPDIKKMNSLFLYYYLRSHQVKKYLNDNAGGTTMANLNLKIVNEIPISLPPLPEQQLIVDELESKLTVCDKIEETISQSLQQSESLKQSILKKAFEGRLINYH